MVGILPRRDALSQLVKPGNCRIDELTGDTRCDIHLPGRTGEQVAALAYQVLEGTNLCLRLFQSERGRSSPVNLLVPVCLFKGWECGFEPVKSILQNEPLRVPLPPR